MPKSPKITPKIIKDAFFLPPEKAIDYLADKGLLVTWDWQEQATLNHAASFTVAKAMKQTILQDIRNMLKKSLKEGLLFKDFQKQLEPKLRARGWWGKVKDPRTGKLIQLGSPHRLKTIYNTNIASSYNSGRWKAMEENKDNRPWLKYVAVLDGSTRPSHAELHGQVHKVGSSFWDTHAPPNGYNCRCRLISIRQGEASKRPKAKPDKGFESNTAKKEWKPKGLDKDIANL